MTNRRRFLTYSAITGIGMCSGLPLVAPLRSSESKRVGIIGLDTSHSIAFTKALNEPGVGDKFGGYKVTTAYPKGSLDIKTSVERIEGYTNEIQALGVEIVDSIDDLVKKTDAVLLETNDERRHLEQALPVLKAGKRLFIDKPMAASLADAMTIFKAAEHYNLPVFSSSSLRYCKGIREANIGTVGKVLGACGFSPAVIEKTHPDLFWYGIHGVEIVFAIMGTGCKTVVRISAQDTDLVVGKWEDGRIGSFRGQRNGTKEYGGFVFGEKANLPVGPNDGYTDLLTEIIRYFQTGVIPVQPDETLEILAFMEAADESKKNGGTPVSVGMIMEKARQESLKYIF
jgi:hypothetical protein